MEQYLKKGLWLFLVCCLFISCSQKDYTKQGHQLKQKTAYSTETPDHQKDIKVTISIDSTKSLYLDFVYVEGDTFYMGGTSEQGNDIKDDEFPVRKIVLSDFYVCKYEVTQELWQMVMRENVKSLAREITELPNREGNNFPMHYISWEDCQIFLTYLNDMFQSQITPYHFSFLTEAQWEYAARGGKFNKAHKYSGSDKIDEIAIYWKNSGDKYLKKWERAWSHDKVIKNNGHISEVGTKAPNELGIYDMSGNVREWCMDFYTLYATQKDTTNPVGMATTMYKIQRGGCWIDNRASCRVSARRFDITTQRDQYTGLRLAIVE